MAQLKICCKQLKEENLMWVQVKMLTVKRERAKMVMMMTMTLRMKTLSEIYLRPASSKPPSQPRLVPL
jgi:hypothetical protein